MSTQKSAQTSVTRSITSRFLLRVAGLPLNTVHELRFPQTVQWQRQILSLERLLIEQKEKITDCLYEAVHTHQDRRDVRRTLINVRRAIFNLRLPADITEVRTLTSFLTPEGSVLLTAWLDLWEQYQHQLALGAPILQQEWQQKRTELRQLVSRDDFRKGVLLASPL